MKRKSKLSYLQEENSILKRELDIVSNNSKQVEYELANLRNLFFNEQASHENTKKQLLLRNNEFFTLHQENIFLQKQNERLCNEIKKFEEVSAALKSSLKQIKTLEKKLNIRKGTEDPYSTSTPSSKKVFKTNSSEEKQKKRGGAVIGHVGHGRTDFAVQEADEIINLHSKGSCCSNQILEYHDTKSKLVINFVPMKLQKIRYDKERYKCQNCGKIIESSIPNVLHNNKYSNSAIAQILTDAYLHQIPIGQLVKRYDINEGTFFGIAHRVSNILENTFMYLCASIRNSKYIHADETPWRNDGTNGYVWSFVNDQFKIFLYRKTRASSVAKEIIGEEELPLVLITDRYSGYSPLKVKKQFCYAHLLRDVKKLKLEFPEDNQINNFCSDLMKELSEAMKLRDKKYPPDKYIVEATKIKNNIMKICNESSNDPGIQNIQNIFRIHEDKLFQWVIDPEISCENNYAERNLRPIVIARKISFGSQSEQGMKTREILSSILHTAQCRGLDVVAFLTKALNAYANISDKTLCPNSYI